MGLLDKLKEGEENRKELLKNLQYMEVAAKKAQDCHHKLESEHQVLSVKYEKLGQDIDILTKRNQELTEELNILCAKKVSYVESHKHKLEAKDEAHKKEMEEKDRTYERNFDKYKTDIVANYQVVVAD